MTLTNELNWVVSSLNMLETRLVKEWDCAPKHNI